MMTVALTTAALLLLAYSYYPPFVLSGVRITPRGITVGFHWDWTNTYMSIAAQHMPGRECWSWLLQWRRYRADETRRGLCLHYGRFGSTTSILLHIAKRGMLTLDIQHYRR